MNTITMKDLLSAGVHFGHQTSKWNPKMKPYIFGARNGIYIVDLQKTVKLAQRAMEFIRNEVASGKDVLIVGTKLQAKEVVMEEASKVGAFYITHRWLGGILTNFKTIRKGIERWEEIETMKTDGVYEKLSKKEVSKLERERKKLENTFLGIRNMKKLPEIIFVLDPSHENIAVLEARKLGLTVVALVDTNCDPDPIDYLIPGNDDAIKSVKLFTEHVVEAISEGKKIREERLIAESDKEDGVEEELKLSEGEELESNKVVETEEEPAVVVEKIKQRK